MIALIEQYMSEEINTKLNAHEEKQFEKIHWLARRICLSSDNIYKSSREIHISYSTSLSQFRQLET